MLSARRAAALLAGLALVLAACGGGSGDGASADEAPSTTAARSERTTSTTEPGPDDEGGACTELNEAAEQLEQVPLFLQLNSPENVTAVRTKLLGDLDLEVFFRAMVTLHQLDGSTSPLGDPRDGIDAYERAAVDAKPLFVAKSLSQASINSYQDALGDPAAFLGHQTQISAALTEAGC